MIYFATLAGLAWIRPLPFARRLRITLAGFGSIAAILLVARTAPTALRDWAPALVILTAYYVSGWFFVTPSSRFEDWLAQWDRRVLGDPATRFSRWPRLLLAYLEVVYLGCFLLVPAGFAALVLGGRSSMADRYWTMVVTAELGSFVSLGIVQARPPWLVERRAVLPDRAVHRLAARMVESFTIRVNTFPSGHVAGSLAVTLAIAGALPWTALVFFLLALSISLACIVGRYHYVVDVVTGAVLALAIWTFV